MIDMAIMSNDELMTLVVMAEAAIEHVGDISPYKYEFEDLLNEARAKLAERCID